MPRSPDHIASLEVAATHMEVRRLAEVLRETCAEAGVAQDAVIDCELALVEAANNVVEHAYSPGADGSIAFDLAISARDIRIALADRGQPMPPDLFTKYVAPAIDADGGRGRGIILSCVDTVDYQRRDDGNLLTLVKARSSS